MSNPRRYPFNRSLVKGLLTIDAPSLGVRLIDFLMVKFGTTQSETETLIIVSSFRKTATFDDICESLTYLTADKVKRCLHHLVGLGHITSQPTVDSHGFIYQAPDATKVMLASIDMTTLRVIAPSSYQEAIVDLDAEESAVAEPDPEVVSEEVPAEEEAVDTSQDVTADSIRDNVFYLLDNLKRHFPDIVNGYSRTDRRIDWNNINQVINTSAIQMKDQRYPILPVDLELAMSFVYKLLMPGVDANQVIAENQASVAEVLKAIYNRRPQILSFEEMLVQAFNNNSPVYGPTPAKREGLIKTLFKVAKEWFANR